MTPSSLLFALTTFMGTMMAISSTNWLILWMGMEINLLSFVPLIASSQNLQETEAAVKYFIIQAVGSSLMLTAGMMSINPATNKIPLITSSMFVLSMIMKLGMAPCHQWLPSVMASVSWTMCLLLATWQKVSPLFMLMFLTSNKFTSMMILIATVSALVGGVGGLNQSQLRALLAYSSIGHMGWMLISMKISLDLFFFYFICYIIITLSLMLIFMTNTMINSNSNMSMKSLNLEVFLITMIIMFSLGGLPPLLGFFPKWMVINYLASSKMILPMIIMITGSLINLFYYFNMSFNFIMLTPQSKGWGSPSLMMIIISSMCTISPLALIMM